MILAIFISNPYNKSMLEIMNLLLAFSSKMGYFGVAFLMTIESSFVPFPSEVVILPAAYLSQQGEMNIIFVILAGIFGSLLGATINYILAFTLGRKVVYSLANSKFAKILLISERKIIKAEQYFLKYGNIATFVGRLVPAIRQLISIPAGFSKMNFKKFIFYTFLGSGIWTTILGILGYAFGANKELLHKYYGEISVFFIVIAVIFILFLMFKRNKCK
jgi:membrane protein DedA with SNARE-associated domain